MKVAAKTDPVPIGTKLTLPGWCSVCRVDDGQVFKLNTDHPCTITDARYMINDKTPLVYRVVLEDGSVVDVVAGVVNCVHWGTVEFKQKRQQE